MDKKRSLLNVGISILSRILLLAAALFVRRLLIRCIGNEVNGLNSLYTSIIGMLSVAELGVGSAIVYSMYRPIIDGDRRKVAALFGLYRKIYGVIGAVIFTAGLFVTPLLPGLIGDFDSLNVNVYVTFLLTLVSVTLSYLYSAKTSLIEAHKNNYITTGILTAGRLLRYGLQVIAILVWRSYTAFLVCQIIETLVIWIMTEAAVRRLHGPVLTMRESVDPDTREEISRNVRAMFMHKIGTILVNSIDSLIISGFIGVVILGKYSNYHLLAGVISGTIALFFSPLTSVVGHLCAKGDPEEAEKYFHRFYCLNFILGLAFFTGYYAVIDDVVLLCFGGGQEIPRIIVFVITLNQFTQYMRRTPLLFRDASGTFYHDRWKPLAEGLANLVLSLAFVLFFPEDYRVAGVITATIVTTLLICDIVEPYVVFRHVFGKFPGLFYVRSYAYTGIFTAALLVMTGIMSFLRTGSLFPVTGGRGGGDGILQTGAGAGLTSGIPGILVGGCLSVLMSLIALGLLALVDRGFRREVKALAVAGIALAATMKRNIFSHQ